MLGGLYTDGYPTTLQHDVMHQVALHVLGIDTHHEQIDPMDAAEVADRIDDPGLRRRLVQSVVAMELLEEPSPELAGHVREFARGVGVDEPMVNAARRAADGQLALMYADIQRNSYYTEEATREVLHGHLWRLVRSKLAYSNVVPSRTIERRWAALADMPVGSLGRATAEFYRIHRFPLPGARRGIGEVGAHHDFVHVLADYPPTPEGEIDVFAFIAMAMPDPRVRAARHDARPVPERDHQPCRGQEGRDRMRRGSGGTGRGGTLRYRAASRGGVPCGRSVHGPFRDRTGATRRVARSIRDRAPRGPEPSRRARRDLIRAA